MLAPCTVCTLSTAAFFAVVGAAFEFLTLVARQARGGVASATQGIVVGLAGLFTIRATQYQLRTEARYIYYAAVLVLVLTVGSRVLSVHHRRHSQPAALVLLREGRQQRGY